MKMKLILVGVLFVLAAALAPAQQQIAPFSTQYGNFLTGFQLAGTYGASGQCPVSSGSGVAWGSCGGAGSYVQLSPTTSQTVTQPVVSGTQTNLDVNSIGSNTAGATDTYSGATQPTHPYALRFTKAATANMALYTGNAGSGNVYNVYIKNCSVATNLLTCNTYGNTLLRGDSVTFSGFGTSTYLNGTTVQVLTASSSSFMASLTHANVTGTDSGYGIGAEQLVVGLAGDSTAAFHVGEAICTLSQQYGYAGYILEPIVGTIPSNYGFNCATVGAFSLGTATGSAYYVEGNTYPYDYTHFPQGTGWVIPSGSTVYTSISQTGTRQLAFYSTQASGVTVMLQTSPDGSTWTTVGSTTTASATLAGGVLDALTTSGSYYLKATASGGTVYLYGFGQINTAINGIVQYNFGRGGLALPDTDVTPSAVTAPWYAAMNIGAVFSEWKDNGNVNSTNCTTSGSVNPSNYQPWAYWWNPWVANFTAVNPLADFVISASYPVTGNPCLATFNTAMQQWAQTATPAQTYVDLYFIATATQQQSLGLLAGDVHQTTSGQVAYGDLLTQYLGIMEWPTAQATQNTNNNIVTTKTVNLPTSQASPVTNGLSSDNTGSYTILNTYLGTRFFDPAGYYGYLGDTTNATGQASNFLPCFQVGKWNSIAASGVYICDYSNQVGVFSGPPSTGPVLTDWYMGTAHSAGGYLTGSVGGLGNAIEIRQTSSSPTAYDIYGAQGVGVGGVCTGGRIVPNNLDGNGYGGWDIDTVSNHDGTTCGSESYSHTLIVDNDQIIASAPIAMPSGSQVNSKNICLADGTNCPASGGTVTSVTFTGDGVVDSSTPSTAVTSSGSVTATIKTQTANTVLAGPTTGSAAAPTFRSLVSADIPNNAANTSGNAATASAVAASGVTSTTAYGAAYGTSGGTGISFATPPTTSGHQFYFGVNPSGSATAPSFIDFVTSPPANIGSYGHNVLYIWTNVINVGQLSDQYGNNAFGMGYNGGTGAEEFTPYGSTAAALGSSGKSFKYLYTNIIYNAAAQTTVSCSTSGTAVFSQPEQGSSDKKVLIHMAACLGTASYTFPTAFTNTPSVYASNNVAASVATTVSTIAVTVTGATTTGSLILEDY